MKKILTIIMLASVTILGTSCKKEITQVVQPSNQTIIFPVSSNKWALNEDQTTFSTVLDVAEIDNYFQGNGAVLVYISFDNGTTYEQIPEVYNGRAFSYAHYNGSIEIDAQAYDAASQQISNPGDCKVKVVLLESAQ